MLEFYSGDSGFKINNVDDLKRIIEDDMIEEVLDLIFAMEDYRDSMVVFDAEGQPAIKLAEEPVNDELMEEIHNTLMELIENGGLSDDNHSDDGSPLPVKPVPKSLKQPKLFRFNFQEGPDEEE